MTRLYDATFEGNSLTGANGGDSITGSPVVYTTSPIKGTYMMQIPDAAAQFLRFSPAAQDEIFLSTYIKITANPTTTMRMIFTSNSGTAVCSIYLTTTGTLQLRDSAATILGTSSALSLSTVYRIGLHYKKGTGANAILEGFLASGDNAFGAAFQSTTNGAETAQINRIDIGNQAAGSTKEKFFDNIRIDTVSMPGPDGGVDNPKAVNVTVTDVVSIQRGISFIKTISAATTLIFAKGSVILKTVTATVGKTVTALKSVGKPVTKSVSTSVSRIMNIPHVVLLTVITILFFNRNIGKIISRAITTTLTFIKGRGYYINPIIVSNISLLTTKNILKPISLVSVITVPLATIQRSFTLLINVSVNVITTFSKFFTRVTENTYLRTNRRNITVGFKNTMLNVLGKNTRNLDLQDTDQS